MSGPESQPLITVVTPSYNQAQYLEAAMRSVLDQEYPKLEYMVVDGCSTDGSPDIVRRHARRLAFWTSEPDAGQGDALNKGFARATGEVLTWLNSDDILLPGALHLVGDLFACLPDLDWLTGIPVNVDASGRLARVGLPVARFRGLIRRGWYHGRGLGFIRQEGTFWRRRLWDRAGGQVDASLHWGMDFELWRRFALQADLVTVASPLAAFRYQPWQKTAAAGPNHRPAAGEDHAKPERSLPGGWAAGYYAEIFGRGLAGYRPAWARPAFLVARLGLLAAWPFVPRILYHRRSGAWRLYRRGRWRPAGCR